MTIYSAETHYAHREDVDFISLSTMTAHEKNVWENPAALMQSRWRMERFYNSNTIKGCSHLNAPPG